MTNYSLRTLNDFFEEIKQIALRNSADKSWNGLTYGSLQWVMGKSLAELMSFLGYNLDMRINESYIDSATQISSLRKIADLYGYSITERTGATTTLSITASNDVTVPKGSRFSSSGGVVFSSLEDLVLSTATSLTGSVVAIHAEYVQVSHTAVGIENEKVQLPYFDILADRIVVTVNGSAYTKKVNLSGSSATDTHYRLVFNDDGTAYVMFGDGVYGNRLSGDDTVLVDVFYGGGYVGNNIATAGITALKSVFTGSNLITTITNTTTTSGGGVATNLNSIKKELQALNTYSAGIISNDKASSVITANKTWVADAITKTEYVLSGSLTIPTTTVYAFPVSSDVSDLTGAQNTELTTFLNLRGEVGVDWVVDNAIKAPIQIDVDVRADSRALQNQTETLIKNALNSDSGAIFSFDELTFDQDILLKDIISSIDDVDNVSFNNISKLYKVPQTMVLQGVATDDDYFLDLELGDKAEDGYMAFSANSTTTATADFFLPVEITSIGTSQVVSQKSNWLKQKHEYSSGSSLDDSGNDWVKADTKLSFKQSTKVWKTNEWTGSNWNDKYQLYISWTDENGDTQTAWYGIASNSSTTITTTENATSPISGTAITTLANANYANISISIVRDLSQGDLVGANGNSYTITHNTGNTIYTSESTLILPLDKYAHVRFAEAALDGYNGAWQSNSDILRARLDTTGTFTNGSLTLVYTTPTLSKRLKYKHLREVFTLADANVNINWI